MRHTQRRSPVRNTHHYQKRRKGYKLHRKQKSFLNQAGFVLALCLLLMLVCIIVLPRVMHP